MRSASHRLGVAGLLVVLLASVLIAQQAPPAPWMQLVIVHVDPSTVDEYIVVQREFAARAKRTATTGRTVSRTEFGDNYRFLITTPVQSLAGFDAPVRNTDAELATLSARLQKYVRGQESYVIRTIPELDNPLPTNQQPNLMVVNVARVSPGREQDYLNVMKSDFLPHFNKANFYHLNGSLTFGGESGFIHVFYVQNFAKLDEGSPVVKALGAAGAQAVTAKLSGIVTSSEQWIARILPDLSYGPAPASPTRP